MAERSFVGYTADAMIVPPLHPHEAERLALLRRCAILDSDTETQIDDLVELAAGIAGSPIALAWIPTLGQGHNTTAMCISQNQG
jgi:hypothetical protein